MDTFRSLAYEHDTPLPDVAGRVANVLQFNGEVVVGWAAGEDHDHGDGTFGYGYNHSYCLTFTKTSA